MAHAGGGPRPPASPRHLPPDALVGRHFGKEAGCRVHHGEELLEERRVAGEVSAWDEDGPRVANDLWGDMEVEVHDIVGSGCIHHVAADHADVGQFCIGDVLLCRFGELGADLPGLHRAGDAPEVYCADPAPGPGVEDAVVPVHPRIGSHEADVLREHGCPAPARTGEEVRGSRGEDAELAPGMRQDGVARGCLEKGV